MLYPHEKEKPLSAEQRRAVRYVKVQPIDSWLETICFCTISGQVSRLKDQRSGHLPGLPVI